MSPDDRRYTKEHEWIHLSGDTAVIGITDHAQKQLGDVVYVEMPKMGQTFQAGQPFGNVESVKAVSELFIPMSGEVIEINEALADAPETLNDDPYGKGWLIKIRIRDTAEASSLMSGKEYDEYTTEES